VEGKASTGTTDIMRISWGPQHPISGQIRFLIDTDGERVFNIIPDLGFCHRGIEKILENRDFIQGVVPLERMVMVDAANLSLGYVEAVEKILEFEPPKRAQYLRTILCEISRINSHLYAFGLVAEAAGGYPAVFLWSVADREMFLDLAEMLTGARWSYSFFIPGGVRRDMPQGFKEKALEVCDFFEERLKAYREAWIENKVWEMRSKGIGILKAEDAVRLGTAGPSLRASGVAMDVRKDEPYEAYGEIDFKVATHRDGDSYARLLVRAMEMEESVKIIRQCVENIPEGEFKKRLPLKRVKPGEAFTRVETGRGEIGFHVVTQGTDRPYRVKISSPNMRNLYVISKMPEISQVLLADVPIIIYSFDPWYLCADR